MKKNFLKKNIRDFLSFPWFNFFRNFLRRRVFKKNRILFTALLLFFLVSAVFLFAKKEIHVAKSAKPGKEIIFLVKKGDSAFEISNNLKKEGVIKFGFIFRGYVIFRGISDKLQAGNYSLSDSMAIPEIADKFAKGDVINKNFVIMEGWDLRDIGLNLESQKIMKADDFFKITGYPKGEDLDGQTTQIVKELSTLFDFLKDKPKDFGLEGYIFPDTYRILAGEDAEEMVKKALSNLGGKLDLKLRKEIASQKKSVFEIIIMASILEKEVKTLQDKKIVSGVLWKRLKIGMPLQVDATIAYITENSKTRTTLQETKIDSLYNTYKYKGLPPGPISNPGLDSIIAAIYPQKSSYLYYLSARNGMTIFSKTFDEHIFAKQKYLR